ncbi:MAG: leucine-rich repeat protein [Abditibacteriota bacterium]|nr:leucine-rich repeat protein [Abditibacteriota bacterium]
MGFKIENNILLKYTGNEKEIIIPKGVIEIAENAFKKTSITKVVIPNTVKKIGMTAFMNCMELESVKLSNNLEELEPGLFSGCVKLNKIKIPDGIVRIKRAVFDYCFSLEKINIPDSVEVIEAYAFDACVSLKKINLPDSVIEIEDNAFEKCINLKKVLIPLSVREIGTDVFKDCESLNMVLVPIGLDFYMESLPEDCKVFGYGMAFFDDGQSISRLDIDTTFNVPDQFTKINGFSCCSDLKTINISKNISEIDKESFDTCYNLEEINVDDDNPYYSSVEGVLYNKEKTILIRYPENKKDKTFIVPDSVTEIADKAFFSCNLIEKIIISDKVTDIGRGAFWINSALKEINISPDNINFTSVDGVFYNKDKTVLITFPPAKEIKEFIVPQSVNLIPDLAFDGCDYLESVTIPEGIQALFTGTFQQSHNLKEINLPNSLEMIYVATFMGCKSLEKIVIPKNVKLIGLAAFVDCSNLKMIKAPKELDLGEACVPKECKIIRY